VQYLSEIITLDKQAVKKVDLTAYESTSDPAKIAIAAGDCADP